MDCGVLILLSLWLFMAAAKYYNIMLKTFCWTTFLIVKSSADWIPDLRRQQLPQFLKNYGVHGEIFEQMLKESHT
jgi:hypothetical protein